MQVFLPCLTGTVFKSTDFDVLVYHYSSVETVPRWEHRTSSRQHDNLADPSCPAVIRWQVRSPAPLKSSSAYTKSSRNPVWNLDSFTPPQPTNRARTVRATNVIAMNFGPWSNIFQVGNLTKFGHETLQFFKFWYFECSFYNQNLYS